MLPERDTMLHASHRQFLRRLERAGALGVPLPSRGNRPGPRRQEFRRLTARLQAMGLCVLRGEGAALRAFLPQFDPAPPAPPAAG